MYSHLQESSRFVRKQHCKEIEQILKEDNSVSVYCTNGDKDMYFFNCLLS